MRPSSRGGGVATRSPAKRDTPVRFRPATLRRVNRTGVPGSPGKRCARDLSRGIRLSQGECDCTAPTTALGRLEGQLFMGTGPVASRCGHLRRGWGSSPRPSALAFHQFVVVGACQRDRRDPTACPQPALRQLERDTWACSPRFYVTGSDIAVLLDFPAGLILAQSHPGRS
jgi:hypothetical protein